MVASKWQKHRFLAKYPSIQQHLPETYLFREDTLSHLLEQHEIVYAKPVIGTGGHGVIRIKKKGKAFEVRRGVSRKYVYDDGELYSVIKAMTKGKEYLVQQGIGMISIDQRPIDYRLLLLRPRTSWKNMGIIGKQAAKHKIVTNHCQGGKAVSFSRSLMKSLDLSREKCEKLRNSTYLLGRRVAKTLGDSHHLRKLGLDIAIDHDLQIWLLEVNTSPRYKLFRYHRDKTLYPRISRYMKMIKAKKQQAEKSRLRPVKAGKTFWLQPSERTVWTT